MFETVINQNWPNRTTIQFTLFGIVVHSENYPKYKEGTESMRSAIRDAEKRFAQHLATVISRPDPFARY